MKVVVCDTGPILHLQEAALLHLLALAGEIIIPPTVDQEIRRHTPGWSDDRPGWLQVVPVPDSGLPQVEELRDAEGLEVGETEAIVLAQTLRADWLLTDDARARLAASLQGLEVHGSLGVVLWAASASHLTRAQALAAVERLATTSLWVSPTVLLQARALIDDLFP